jgi:hypothetical protein
MHVARWCRRLGLVAVPLLFFAPAPAQQEQVAVKVVNYGELGRAVKAHKGKVVVVDFWGLT